jgi:hypothetical protein
MSMMATTLAQVEKSVAENLGPEATGWLASAKDSALPHVAYNMACNYAVQPLQDGEDRMALVEERLKVACSVPSLKESARKDAAFKSIRADPKFIKLVSDQPLAGFWKLKMFTALEKPLAEVGAHTPVLLGNNRYNTKAIRKHLGLKKPVFNRLVRLAVLIKAVTEVTDKFEPVTPSGKHADIPEDPEQLKAAARAEIHSVVVDLVAAFVDEGFEDPKNLAEGWNDTKLDGFLAPLRLRLGKTLRTEVVMEWVEDVRKAS